MKKIAFLLSLVLLSALLCACGLLSPADTTGGGPTAPTLAEIDAGIRAAEPTESRVAVSARYAASGITLTSHITLKKNGESEYYTYEIERLLPTEEALAAGSPKEKLEGHFHLVGEQTVDASEEVDAALLAEISSLSMHLPRLAAENFSEYAIREEAGSVTLTATVKDSRLSEMLDAEARLSGLSFTVRLTSDLVPLSLSATFISEGGTPTSYEAEYTYTPVTIP